MCARIYKTYGERLYYHPDARVDHKVYDWQYSWLWLLDRAYWQGYSKSLLESSVPDSTDTERTFLTELFKQRLPDYLRQAVNTASLRPLASAGATVILTGAVGLGYMAAKLKNTVQDR